MEQFTIHTTQNISIEQPLASVAERIIATIIDIFVIISYVIVAFLITGALEKNPMVSFIILIPLLFYHLFFELAMNGQSPGKIIMKIKVVSENGAAASFTSIFIRWVFRLIDVLIMFGSIATLFIIITEKNQRLGDITGKTIVLRTRQRKRTDSIYYELPNDYELQFPEVEKLSESDLLTLNEVLGFLNSSCRNYESKQYAVKMKKSLSKKMGIESNLPPEMFLKTLKKDYNYIHQHS